MSRLAVVVVRWRGGDEVRRCLASALADTSGLVGPVVLVDSGSGDGGAARLGRELPGIRVVALEENHSFAWAAGRGVDACSEPLLLLLNPDAELEADTVRRLVEALDERPDAAGVVPLLVGADGRTQHRWQLRRLPRAVDLALGRPGRPAFPAAPPATPVPVPQPAAAAWLVRRAVWDALGGLDPAFAPAWWEDADFCARLVGRLGEPGFPARGGFVVEPAARARHLGGSSVASLPDAAFLGAYHRNLLRYAARHHPHDLAPIRRGLRLSLAVRALLRPARRTAYRAAARALADT